MAGPDVFFQDALSIAEQKKNILKEHNLEGHHPFDNSVQTENLEPEEIAQLIFKENVAMMDRCDLIIANLTPFRGPSADVGTVFELGYMFAKDKPIFGYSNIDESYLKRVQEHNNAPVTSDDNGMLWDDDNLNVENFNLRDNLMIDCAFIHQAQMIQKRSINDTKLTVLRDFVASPVDKNELYTDLSAFEAQIKNIAYLRDQSLLF